MPSDWRLEGVTVAAGAERAGKAILQDVHATFRAGAITLIVGSNGAGKSTLLETIAGLRSAATGQILLGDTPLWLRNGKRSITNREVLLRFGLALQHSEASWFQPTVKDELLYSLKPYGIGREEAEQPVKQAIEAVGLDTELLARDPWSLSGGQQRRLSLACLLAGEPEWLLLDEPTAGLDAEGIERLCAILAAHKAHGRGAIVVTHDLDALLPLADEIAAVEGGKVRAAASAAAWAAASGAAAPQALRALAELRATGFAAAEASPQAAGGGPLWPQPRELAAELAAALARRAAGGEPPRPQALRAPEAAGAAAGAAAKQQRAQPSAALLPGTLPGERAKEAAADETMQISAVPMSAESAVQSSRIAESETGLTSAAPNAAPSADASADPSSGVARSQPLLIPAAEEAKPAGSQPLRPVPAVARSQQLDPRALVIAYLLLSSAMLAGSSWQHTIASAAAAFAILVPLRAALRPWRFAIRAYVVMLLIMSLVAGTAFFPLAFHADQAIATASKLFKLMLVMLLGMPFLALITPLRLQRAIEQTFGFLSRMGLRIMPVALTVTVMFRFIPLLADEWSRFALIAAARGKAAGRPGRLPMRMLLPSAVPYLRSILRLAEQLAEAMEARGIGHPEAHPTRGFKLAFKRTDWAVAIGALVVSAILFWMAG